MIAFVSCQGGGKVKAEAIDLELFDPVAEAIEHEPLHHRLAEVERVSTTGGVLIVPLVVLAVVARVI